MKLYLNDKQRNLMVEILSASRTNAINGSDFELVESFDELLVKVSPANATYVNLKRADAETIAEFADITRQTLDKALKFLEDDKDRGEEEKEELRLKAQSARDEIEEIITQLNDKIRANP